MARQDFPYTTFTDSAGNPLSFGTIEVAIIDDVNSPDGLLCRGLTLQQGLDTNGVVLSVPQVWPNAELLPLGSYYVLNAYTEAGQLVLGPLKVEV